MTTRNVFYTSLAAGWLILLGGGSVSGGTPTTDSDGSEKHPRPFPATANGAVDTLFAFACSTNLSFDRQSTQKLVDFVSEASASDSGWVMPDRRGSAGSAYVVKVKVPLQQYLSINFHPRIPDYAVFPASLRYSDCLDTNVMQDAYACIQAGPTGTQEYVTSRMTGVEEITPNPESGGYFSYTNARTFLRCTVGGREVLFSCSETTGPSTTSNRGVPVGPHDQALYYYSEKPGLNLTGMTWISSQVRNSTTLSVYVALSSNETAVATFAWLNAGWKGLNVIRPCHILNSQRNTLDFSRRIAESPGVTASRLADVVEAVMAMSPEAVNARYDRYLTYVRSCQKNKEGGIFCRTSLLDDLYDAKVASSIPLSHRRALIVQEHIRALLGIATWSVPSDTLVRR